MLATEFEDQPVIIYLLDLDLTLQLQNILSISFESAERSFQGAFVSARSPALLSQKCRLLGTA